MIRDNPNDPIEGVRTMRYRDDSRDVCSFESIIIDHNRIGDNNGDDCYA